MQMLQLAVKQRLLESRKVAASKRKSMQTPFSTLSFPAGSRFPPLLRLTSAPSWRVETGKAKGGTLRQNLS